MPFSDLLAKSFKTDNFVRCEGVSETSVRTFDLGLTAAGWQTSTGVP